MSPARRAAACAAAFWALPALALAQQQDDADLAKKLSNPVSNLISVPFQYNYDCCFGPDHGDRSTLNIQPVMPVPINSSWSVIIRTILPVIEQARVSPQTGGAFGLGDTTQSFFFTTGPSKSGFIWAVGPAFLWPTGTNDLGSGKWGAGPTFVVLKQQGGWSYGMLANQIWSYANANGDRGARPRSTGCSSSPSSAGPAPSARPSASTPSPATIGGPASGPCPSTSRSPSSFASAPNPSS